MKGSRKVSFSVWEEREKKSTVKSCYAADTQSKPRHRAPRRKPCVCLHPERHEHLVVGEPWKTKQHFPGCVLRLRTALYFMKNRFHGEQHRATLQALSLSPGNRQNISTVESLSPAEKKQTWFCLPRSFPTFFKLS